MLINCQREISSYLDVNLLLVSRTHVCLGWGEVGGAPPAFLALLQTDWKKLTYWSQIVSSAGGNPISPGYLWESSVSPCARDSEETFESYSRICEHYDGYDTQHWHSENGLFFGFSQWWKLNKSNTLYLDSDLNPQSPFQTIWTWDASLTFCRKCLHMSRFPLWPFWNFLEG